MSDKEEEQQQQQQQSQPQLKLSDNAIIMLRELLQLCMLTNTNLVDNYRAIRFEIDPETNTYLVPSKAYMESYNAMIQGLEKKLEEQEKLHVNIQVPTGNKN